MKTNPMKELNDNERLVEEGIAGAEHDQMRQASLKHERHI
jgi:hypothetical protein